MISVDGSNMKEPFDKACGSVIVGVGEYDDGGSVPGLIPSTELSTNRPSRSRLNRTMSPTIRSHPKF